MDQSGLTCLLCVALKQKRVSPGAVRMLTMLLLLYHRKPTMKSSSNEEKGVSEEGDAEEEEKEERLEKLQVIFPQRSRQELQEVGADGWRDFRVVSLPSVSFPVLLFTFCLS